jgi:hypothetical protein
MTRTRKPTRRRKPAYTPVATVNTIEVPPDSPLTTKEGWAAFVRHTPQPPQSLTASPLMAMSPKDRARHEDRLRDYHADLPLVNTPTIQKVISTGRLLIQLNRRQISARRGMVISGMSGTGKTTALTQLGRAHELAIRRRFPDDGDRLPVIYVTVPPAATPRMLAVEFARFLGLEFPARANVTDITDAVCSVAAHTRVDLVLVDEIHNISLATRAGAEVSDQLKYFAERYLQLNRNRLQRVRRALEIPGIAWWTGLPSVIHHGTGGSDAGAARADAGHRVRVVDCAR